jgi:hypothetical protein
MAGDRDEFGIETVEGLRPRGTFGERVLIGVAGLALIGGALLAVGNLLPDDPDAGRAPASATASPTPRASGTPRPSAPPRVITLERIPAPPAVAPEPRFFGWIRTRGEVPLLAAEGSDDVLEILPAGFVGHATNMGGSGTQSAPGWLSVDAPDRSGWIDASDSTLIERFPDAPYRGGSEVYGLAAGASGFVAWGADPDGSLLIVSSSDGATWRAADAPLTANAYVIGVAHGPLGWLAAVMTFPSGEMSVPLYALWQSDDGLDWQPLGSFPGDLAQISGAAAGYIVLTTTNGGGVIWQSSDGVTWHELTNVGLARVGQWGAITSVSDGFLVRATGGSSLFSRDGVTWIPGDDGPHGEVLHVIETWDGLLAVDEQPAGTPRTWHGTIGTQGITWEHRSLMDGALDGTRIAALVPDGDPGLAIGWDTATGDPVAWRMSVAGWRSEPFPAAEIGGVPTMVAAGPAGMVAVGYRPTLTGTNPVFWHRAEDGWHPETSPVITPAPAPSLDRCAPLPTDALTFSSLDVPLAIACHGDASITFRAFAVDCRDCFGGAPVDDYDPSWLADYATSQLVVSPIDSGYWLGTPLALRPPLAFDQAWAGHEIEITGHFDDPAASSCTFLPGPTTTPWRLVPQEIVNTCRLRFVVTAVTLVD